MPRRYDDYLTPPNERSGGWIFVILIGIAIAGLILGSGWISLQSFEKAVATQTLQPAVATSAAAAFTNAQTSSTTRGRPAASNLSVADWDLPTGHFYTQTNGDAAPSTAKGFAVTDAEGIPFWTEFQRLGGVPMVGYPLSGRFPWKGMPTQVFQRAILQWNPGARLVQVVNIMDELHAQGKDDWLAQQATPRPLPPAFDQGKSRAQAAADRLSILEYDPPMHAFYSAAPDSMVLYGLPTSVVTDMGDHWALRLQRNVLQRWKVDEPWAPAGRVTAANSGQLAVEAGLIPSEALQSQDAQ